MSLIETIEIASIEELHNFLSPIGDFDQYYNKKNYYLFRGEGSDENELVPSLFRGSTIKQLYHSLRMEHPPEEYLQYEETYQRIELASLIQFFRLANNNGIPLPDDNSLKASEVQLGSTYTPAGEEWPPPELLDMFSLARHYEFPTRMIDWSDNIYTALYFACSNALKSLNPNGKMVVYILNYSEISKTDAPIHFVRPLRFYNTNAQAQSAVLSYIGVKNQLSSPTSFFEAPSLKESHALKVNKEPLDKYLDNYFKQRPADIGTIFYKVKISKNLAKNLYEYLDAMHYTAEKIFPDLHGIVHKMLDDETNWFLFDQHQEKSENEGNQKE